MTCKQCSASNKRGSKFCSNCGAALEACPRCSAEVPPDSKFCSNCGQDLAGAAEGGPSASSPGSGADNSQRELLRQYLPQPLLDKLERAQSQRSMEGERRTVTMLFCDIEGSTAAAESMDPEDWAEIVNGAFEHLISPVYKYEGTLARLMGDAILAFFGAPIAHEDDPVRAVLAGLEIIESIGPYSEMIKEAHGFDLGVRVGINTGLVVVGEVGSDLRVEYTALGDAVNLAARMEQTAQRNTVQISENTHRLIAPAFETESLGEVEVKGKSEPVKTWKVIAAKDKAVSLRGIEGLRAPLIGRDAERAELELVLEELRTGRGSICSVMAEAGLGKSRLVAEVRDGLVEAGVVATVEKVGSDLRELREGAGIWWVEGRSHSYESQTSYAPFRALLSSCFGIDRRDDPVLRFNKVADSLEGLVPGVSDDIRPYICTLLEIPVEGKDAEAIQFMEPGPLRERIFGAVATFFAEITSSVPTVAVFEDLHWADQSSMDLIESLMPLTTTGMLVILAVFRPRREDSAWRFHETASRDFDHKYTSIELKPLAEDESRLLISSLLAIDGLPERIRLLILEKAEGNPFFVEEVIRSLLDSGVVVREGDAWKATRDIEDVSLPETIDALLTARLDRLDHDSKSVACAAAVIGREFRYGTLAELMASEAATEPALETLLAELERRGLIRLTARIPEPKFMFKHVLTHQAAYDGVLLANRRKLHTRIAELLEGSEPESVYEISRHFLAAGESDRALPYLVAAGERSMGTFGLAEAKGHFTRALEIFSEESDIDLGRRAFEGLFQCQSSVMDMDGAMATLAAMEEMGRRRKDIPSRVSALNKKAFLTLMATGDPTATEELLNEAVELADQVDDKRGVAEANTTYCVLYVCTGQLEDARKHQRESAALGDELHSHVDKAFGLTHEASTLLFMTDFDEAEAAIERAYRFTQETGQLQFHSEVVGNLRTQMLLRNGDLEGAWESATEGLALARRIGAVMEECDSAWLAAQVAQHLGRWEDAFVLSREALAIADAIGMAMMQVPILATLASVQHALGADPLSEIAGLHDRAKSLMTQPLGDAFGSAALAELGFCALKMGSIEAAANYFEEGLATRSPTINLARPALESGLGMTLISMGDVPAAKERISSASDQVATKSIEYLRPLVGLAGAQLAVAEKDTPGAMKHFGDAVDAAHGMSMLPAETEVLSAWALHLRSSEPSLADEKLARAAGLVDEMASRISDEEMRAAFRSAQAGLLQPVA